MRRAAAACSGRRPRPPECRRPGSRPTRVRHREGGVMTTPDPTPTGWRTVGGRRPVEDQRQMAAAVDQTGPARPDPSSAKATTRRAGSGRSGCTRGRPGSARRRRPARATVTRIDPPDGTGPCPPGPRRPPPAARSRSGRWGRPRYGPRPGGCRPLGSADTGADTRHDRDAGSTGVPSSPGSAPRARLAAAGAKTSRPSNVGPVVAGVRRRQRSQGHGPRSMATADSTPP